MIKISVVLVTHNDGRWLSRCTQSLQQQTVWRQCELIVVDNGSERETRSAIEAAVGGLPNASVLETGGDNGFALACNRGAARARGEYVLFLSPDTWLEPDCLERLASFADATEVALVSATVLEYETNALCWLGSGSKGFDLMGNPVPKRLRRDDFRFPQLFSYAHFPFIRREVFSRLGMLDPGLFMYSEEFDLGWRAAICGYQVAYCPLARLHHWNAATVDPQHTGQTSAQKRYLANRNRLLVIARNAQHILLVMLLPALLLDLAEMAFIWLATRSLAKAKQCCWKPLLDVWAARRHILAQRRELKHVRKYGDWYMLRWLSLRFGRSNEIRDLLGRGTTIK